MDDSFNIEEVRIADSYDPNDPFSPLPPAPKPVKIYENLNDILIRTSREQYQQERLAHQRQRRRQREKDRKQRRRSEVREVNNAADDKSNVQGSIERKTQQDRDIKPAEKTVSRYVELKQTMKEMYCQPPIRPTTNDPNRPKKIAKKPQAPKRRYQQEIDNIFDFTPINNYKRRDGRLKISKDIKPTIEIKKEPDEATNSSNTFEFVEDDLPLPNNHLTSNQNRISATENDPDSSLPHANQQVAATDNFDEPVNVKCEFEDTFVKDEPIDDDYYNQPATSYDENAEITAESLRNSIMHEIENRNPANAIQTAPSKRVEVGCAVVENFNYDRLLQEDDENDSGMPDTRYVEVQGRIKEELSDDDYFV